MAAEKEREGVREREREDAEGENKDPHHGEGSEETKERTDRWVKIAPCPPHPHAGEYGGSVAAWRRQAFLADMHVGAHALATPFVSLWRFGVLSAATGTRTAAQGRARVPPPWRRARRSDPLSPQKNQPVLKMSVFPRQNVRQARHDRNRPLRQDKAEEDGDKREEPSAHQRE